MRIIHFSDFHLDKSRLTPFNNIIYNLECALKKIQEEHSIDLILFTGDLLNQGGRSFEDISDGFKTFKTIFIERLCKSINLAPDRFIFTPGNHDVCRQKDSKALELGLSQILVDIKSVAETIDSEDSDNSISRINDFKKFEKEYYSQLYEPENYKYSKFCSNFKLIIDGHTIGISALNTAWRCWDSSKDKNNIWMGPAQIQNSLEFLSSCELRIAMSHHNYTWLRQEETVKDERLLSQNYDLYFCGHTHSPKTDYKLSPDGNFFEIVAPGILSENINESDTQYKNGFGVVDYDFENKTITESIYRQKDGLSFYKDLNFGTLGEWTVDISTGDIANIAEAKRQAFFSIKENVSELNQHLLSYNTETNAPKSIKDIFVMPHMTKIDKLEEDDEDFKEETIDNFNKIISSTDNFVIFGIKESGKTILLDKILLEILESHKNILPARLNFKDFETDIISKLKDIWHINRNTCEIILREGNVILLVDDISFSVESHEKLLALNTYYTKFKGCRFIGTCLEKRFKDITFDTEALSLISYQRIEIAEFRTKQIKELAKKWISKKGTKLNQKKLDIILDAFSQFNLPRTPFSVSMFLWILEREDSYRAQNNSILIECFIEELLKAKDGKSIGSRQVFDYKNKLVLLAGIACEMLKEDNANYSLSLSEALKFVEDHLEALKFKNLYTPKKILNDLLDTGIIIEDGNNVRFRFACFFEFMLAKQMEFSPAFKEEVLNERYYIKFFNEIIYYTGLHRGESEILKMIMEQLEYHYIDINDIVFKRVRSIDDFFNVDRSLVEQITVDDLLQVLPEKQTEEEKNNQEDQKYEIQASSNDQNVIKRKDSNKFETYNKVLMLAMNVLRNSEEIKEKDMKYNSYKTILKNSISYCILYKLICESFVSHSDKFPKERIEEFMFVLRVLPNVHLELLSANIGSFKLSEVFKTKIDDDILNISSISEFERFLSVFLYADVRGTEFKEVASTFIRSFNKKYIADACYFKLLFYYYKSTEDNFDKFLMRNLVDLYVKVNENKNGNKRIEKSKVIQELINKKKANRRELGE